MEENKEEKKNKEKKLSALQIAMIAIICVLVVAIVVQIGVLVSLNSKTNSLKEKNDEVSMEQTIDPLQEEALFEFKLVEKIN